MASKSLCLSILLTLFIVNEVRSGIIFDGIDKTIKGTKCTLHKIGEKLYQHQHEGDPCEDQENVSENFDENANKIEKLYDDVGKKGKMYYTPRRILSRHPLQHQDFLPFSVLIEETTPRDMDNRKAMPLVKMEDD
ncbi:hypothetical protein NQ318_002878 [Aromia moschata]|uniref:Uncharacterized protein n=1 Tax=Aromia moschata TaxID=1265417 RepID=A0AAV8Y920_9CUCU|nr:hypothetical protein NQ318_002878 [Aromia moschata]